MSRIGTDVVALAAILGSAAVGGVVTLAALERGPEPAVADCLAASVMPAPRIIVESHAGHAGGDTKTIVITPKVRVRATYGCGTVIVDEVVRADLDRVLAELDESRATLERVYEQDLERRLNEEMARLEKELSRLGNEVGR